MKLLARLVVVLGVVAIAWVLFGEGPRDVALVYELPPAAGPAVLEIELRRGGGTIRRAEFRLPPAPDARQQVRHEVRLPPGHYDLAWRIRGPAGDERGLRPLSVQEDGTIVLSLAP